MALGRKTGGRKPGGTNKINGEVAALLSRMKCDPFEGMARIASGKIDCGVCHGVGRTKYKLADGSIGERTCESCYGTLMERVSPELRGKMLAELGQYVHAKRKAVEHTGADGKAIEHTHRIVFVD